MFSKQAFKNAEQKPSRFDSKKNFQFSCHNMWALEEAFRFIDSHPDLDTQEALMLFIKTMDEFSCKARSEKSSFMFSVAKDYGEYLLDCSIFEFNNLKEVRNEIL